MAIPIAIVLAGSQMSRAGSVTLKNTVVLAGVYVFALLMAFLVRNQLSTLSALGDEIGTQKAILAKKAKLSPV